VEPVYPRLAISAKVQGQVFIEATIATDGTVKNARVLNGNSLLHPAALEAVKQWRYTPTLLNGQPVEVLMTVYVNFNLK
jgi:protein TonB